MFWSRNFTYIMFNIIISLLGKMNKKFYTKSFEVMCNFSVHKLNIDRKWKAHLHNTVKSHYLVLSPINPSQIVELHDKLKLKMNFHISYYNCQGSTMEVPKIHILCISNGMSVRIFLKIDFIKNKPSTLSVYLGLLIHFVSLFSHFQNSLLSLNYFISPTLFFYSSIICIHLLL